MALRLNSMSDVFDAWSKIFAIRAAIGPRPTPRIRREPGWYVAGADLSPDFDAIGINIWIADNHFQFNVFREGFTGMEINLPGRQGSSSTLADIDGDVWLLHSGRFKGDHPPRAWHETTKVGGKTYFKVSAVNDREFFQNVCLYYLGGPGPVKEHSIVPDEEIKIAIEAEIEKAIEDDPTIKPTEKWDLVLARRGQGRYRLNLMEIEKCCRVTGVSDPRLLRASHMKPWRDCKPHQERLDGGNGLLLAPHIDHLFDQGYISFEDEGSMLVSPTMDPEQLRRLGISKITPLNVGPFNARQRPYLNYHRTHIFHAA